jgi:imidazoleglycerol-phosphate dehydratase
MGKSVSIARRTKETDIELTLGLCPGERSVDTGIGFFDHMLNTFALHGGFSLSLTTKGDLTVDGHHTVEDTGIVLGTALAELAGDKSGIARFGSAYVPMDEALAFAAVDISGRPFLWYDAELFSGRVGDFDCQLAREFWRALAFAAGVTLHVRVLYGENDHHKLEAQFKAVARALKAALAPSGEGGVPSAKGVL